MQKKPSTPNQIKRARRERRFARPLNSWKRRLHAWLNMLFVDHGILRYAYLNLHRLGENAWRSAQPAPDQIRRLARRGVRTVVNLRGEGDLGSYALEKEACARLGLRFAEVKLRSRMPPSKETLEEVAVLLEQIAYPALFHCKSGADRAGLLSALYMLLREGAPVAEAKKQLHWRFGHFRQARTGVLDHFFDMFETAEADARARGETLPFMQWVREEYDPSATKRTFHASRWASTLVDTILRRE